MIIVLGRITLYGAKLDLSLVSSPLNALTKFGLKGKEHHFHDVHQLAISTILEIGKAIATEVDLKYTELVPAFQSMITGLDKLAKIQFETNKFSDIPSLMQPLIDLKKLFDYPNLVNHQDSPILKADIERVLAEFQALQEVMQTIPPLNPHLTVQPYS